MTMQSAGAAARGSRRERKTERARAALLDAALRVMSTRGVYLTRIEDITEAADVAKGSFYAHFKDKDDILAAIVDLIQAGFREGLRMEELLTLARPERVRRLVLAHLEFYRELPGRFVIMHQARGICMQDASSFPSVRVALGEYLELLARVLAGRGGRAGRDTRDAALMVAGLIAGYASFRFTVGPRPAEIPSGTSLVEACVAAVEAVLERRE
ncbi:MAG: TetR/AcrR family transcriptional regulator [Myxococcota bacterium]